MAECDVCHKKESGEDIDALIRAGWRQVAVYDPEEDYSAEEGVVCSFDCGAAFMQQNWDKVLEELEEEEDDESLGLTTAEPVWNPKPQF